MLTGDRGRREPHLFERQVGTRCTTGRPRWAADEHEMVKDGRMARDLDDPVTQHGLTWDQMTVGMKLRTAGRTVTETDLVNFVTAMGFTEPLFMDAHHASEVNPGYSGRLVPGALVFSLAEGLVMQQNVLHGTGIAFLSAEIDVRAPVFVGDTLECLVEVTESRESSSGGRGVVTTRNTVRKVDGPDVLVYSVVRLIAGST